MFRDQRLSTPYSDYYQSLATPKKCSKCQLLPSQQLSELGTITPFAEKKNESYRDKITFPWLQREKVTNWEEAALPGLVKPGCILVSFLGHQGYMTTCKKASLLVGFLPGIGNWKTMKTARVKGPATSICHTELIHLHLIRILSVR